MKEPLYRKQGRKYERLLPSEILPPWTDFMVTAAVRYSLGRSSYAPDVAMRWVQDNWELLPDGTHFVIVRDVIDWLADRHLWDTDGSPAITDYREEWTRFALGRIEAKGDGFGHRAVNAALFSPEMRQNPTVQPFAKWMNDRELQT